ncbi:MAG: S8 family peptidase [Planctomycetota bacterium]|jgi:hypothetical protein
MAADGLVPEQVVVLETRGDPIEFVRAVDRIDGIDWLADLALPELEADDDFYISDREDQRTDKPIEGHLYLSMSTQAGIDQLLRLWDEYKRDGDAAEFPYGLTPIRTLFGQLKDVRRWGPEDRICETGFVEDLKARLQDQRTPIRFEAELWFRESSRKRDQAYSAFSRAVGQSGGRCVKQAAIDEIRYHGALAELPVRSVRRLLQDVDSITSLPETHLLRVEQVFFYRPVGQCAFPLPFVDDSEERLKQPSLPTRLPEAQGDPILALLDGLPLEGHALLAGRLKIDDPDGFGAHYSPSSQIHGTAMASLILHGDLDAHEEPLGRPIYVRPIMKPDPNGREQIPEDELPVDLTWRAFRRMIDTDGDETPSAPTVRIVSFSIGDPNQPFNHALSPWARMMDWLAWKYRLLILVSAGNQADKVKLGMPPAALRALSSDRLQTAILRNVDERVRLRRIIAPAEAVNVLTVGATHDDRSSFPATAGRYDPTPRGTPSTYSAAGLGYANAVKPDILMPGGRMCYGIEAQSPTSVTLAPQYGEVWPPGHRTAHPGRAGETDAARWHTRGTSNATALAARAAAEVFEMLEQLRSEPDGSRLTDRYVPVLLKALLVHAASWDSAYDVLKNALRPEVSDGDFRTYVARYLGYGSVSKERCLGCSGQRATLLGFGDLVPERDGSAHTFSIPLPSALGGTAIERRLTATLAWLTPFNPKSRKYRQAALYLTIPVGDLQVSRKQAIDKAAKRGTVQHEVLTGDAVVPIADGQSLELRVNARPFAVSLVAEAIPYALAISLEVAEGLPVPIYQQVRERLAARVRIITAAGTE